MAPWGKVHSAVHSAGDRIKGGLAWANHKYQAGMHLASKTNELLQTGKKIAGIFMPALDRIMPAATPHIVQGIGALDKMRDTAINTQQDVLDQIGRNSDIVDAMRKAGPLMKPYYS